MSKIVRGQREVGSGGSSLLGLSSGGDELLHRVDLVGRDRSAAREEIDLEDYDPATSFCEIELEGGEVVWMRPDEVPHSRYFETVAQRDLVPTRSRARGTADVYAKALRVIQVDPAKAFGGMVRKELVKYLERNIKPAMLRLGTHPREPEPFVAEARERARPYLLMLHGTFSSTEGSFGKLYLANSAPRWRRLTDSYGSRILSLEHKTLSVSPLDNALDALAALPGGARLHLLSHSRGGLIGELLARCDDGGPGLSAGLMNELREIAPELAEGAAKLDALLRDRAIVVERFVRVACPARGTTLASERLRDWLTIGANLLASLLKKGTDAAFTALGAPVLSEPTRIAVDLLKALTLEVVQPSEIAGLAAMDPAGAMIRGLINSDKARASGRLAVVAGDTEGSGVLGRLKMFAVDRFFQRDNDLVVDTASMTGGALRAEAFRHLAVSPSVTHFTYFEGPETSEVIVRGLVNDRLAGLPEFSEVSVDQRPLRQALRTPALRSARADAPIVYLLPGIMGTQLAVDDSLVWVSLSELNRGGFGRLRADQTGVTPIALDGETYQPIADYLASDHEVIPFPYDWRLPIADSAEKLNKALLAKLDEVGSSRPIRLLAHSMGGLVARAMMLRADSAWPQIRQHAGARLIMMGTPNSGSHAITKILTGYEMLVTMLGILDWKNSTKDIVDIASGFRGALDMLPEGTDRDYYTTAAWDHLAQIHVRPDLWPKPSPADMDASRKFRQALSAQDLSKEPVVYVAGHNGLTPTAVRVFTQMGKKRLRFATTDQGDGRVPWKGGIPDGVPTWYVRAKHGDIPAHKKSFLGFRELLEKGVTDQLTGTAPASRFAPGELFEEEQEFVSFLPDERDIQMAAIGGDPAPWRAEHLSLPKITVRVVWGNLRFAECPVLVGHYLGSGIVSAEKALDHFVEGALTRRLELGRYPGELGSALAIPHARGSLPGAIVVGLGQVNLRMSRNDLVKAVFSGVTEWIARSLESSTDSATDGARALAFVAVGSGTGGMSLRDAGSAILQGVRSAIDVLDQRRGRAEVERLGLSTVEFIELYEDRAHTLWHGLWNELSSGKELGARFGFAEGRERVEIGKEGRRLLVNEETGNWYSVLKIGQQGSALVFESIGDRARAELRGVATHRHQIDRIVRDAIQARGDEQRVAKALFELLVPTELKDDLPNQNQLRLIVDPESARYPWEIVLSGRSGVQERQNSLTAPGSGPSLIRTLTSVHYRTRPRMAIDNAAMVVGDPLTHKQLTQLPGALNEANLVHRLLGERGVTLYSGVYRNGYDILVDLYACSYRLLHFAGHGIEDLSDFIRYELSKLDRETQNAGRRADQTASVRRRDELMALLDELGTKPVSAMVIGHDTFLTYSNIEQMDPVPELVFINCCSLGTISASDDDYLRRSGTPSVRAANFAEKFIEVGVLAVIAAGWPVDDDAAQCFATHFYDALLNGEDLGESVRRARTATREGYPNSNTWAAYQCYGDPAYRYKSGPKTSSSQGADRRYGSPRHMAFEAIHGAGSQDVLADLIDRSASFGFGSSGELCAYIADAYRGMRLFPEAAAWYAKALGCEDAALPVKAIEQFCNVLARMQTHYYSDHGAPSRDWIDRSDQAIRMLTALLESPTAERYNLLASVYKRRAVAMTGQDRIDAAAASAQAYEQAAALKASSYAFLNAGIMLAALDWLSGGTPSAASRKWITDAVATGNKAEPKDFWSFVSVGDLNAARLFAKIGKSAANQTKVAINAFTDAKARCKDKGELGSVVEQLECMRELLKGTGASPEIGDALGQMLDALT